MDERAVERSVKVAVAQYALNVEAVTPVRFTNNAVFRLRSASCDYALRIHRPGYRTPQQTRSELTYLSALSADGDQEVPLPIRTRDGDLVSFVEVDRQTRHASVVKWLDGQVRRPGRGAGPRTLFRIGQAQGHIHHFSESFDPPADFDLPSWDVETMFRSDLSGASGSTALRRVLNEVQDRVAAVFSTMTPSPDTFGVLHHDFILLNLLHVGRRTAVIDFDDCGWGFYMQDLGGLLGNLKDYRTYRLLRESFVAGYQSVRPFPTNREQDLELMIALRHCTSVLWLLERHQAGAIPDDQFQRVMAYRVEEIEAALTTPEG